MKVRGPDHGESGGQCGRVAGPPGRADAQIPAPPWQRLPDRKARRRREPISRDAIVAAAIRLLDREGLAALSMRRLADELGAGAASLYWHVGSKDGLLDLVIDELVGEGQVPAPDPARLAGPAQGGRAGSAGHQPAAPLPGPADHRPYPAGTERAAVLRTRAGDLAGGRLVAPAGGAGFPAADRRGERFHGGRDRGGAGKEPRARSGRRQEAGDMATGYSHTPGRHSRT